MQYIKVTFSIISQDMSDILMAKLSDAGFNGFEEADNKLLAYIDATEFHEDKMKERTGISSEYYEIEIVPSQNWNALWESNFEPVVVDGLCTIRAHFHDIKVATRYDIVITPKMSFGTGHHATTQLMIMMMSNLDLHEKSVLDFGTGTGVLAILAEKLGASEVLAIDNDEWSVENAVENIGRNQCEKINVQLGSLEVFSPVHSDVILANINRHILLSHMQQLYQRLNNHGIILMSGLLTEDKDAIMKRAADVGFHLVKVNDQSNWIALLFEKA
jgi:ribosomal protein L11 methyltransferase